MKARKIRHGVSIVIVCVVLPCSGRTDEAPGGPAVPFWQAVSTDTTDHSAIMMAARDWQHQDGLDLSMPDAPFEEKALAHLAWVEKTLAYVKKAGAETATYEARYQELAAKTRECSETNGDWRELYFALRRLRRRAIFAHPALDFERILVNVNPPTTYSHNGDQFLGRHSRAGRGLGVLSGWKEETSAIR